jgi:hypothetical protein
MNGENPEKGALRIFRGFIGTCLWLPRGRAHETVPVRQSSDEQMPCLLISLTAPNGQDT